MFTGIIQEIGVLLDIRQGGKTAQIQVRAPKICADAQSGDSICVNGVCLTVTHFHADAFHADISSETLERTTFLHAQTGDLLNLEPALRPLDRMGGHIVAGHVDGVGVIDTLVEEGEFSQLVVRFPLTLAPFIAEKGSICVDGISLTIAKTEEDYVMIALVPFTIRNTNLRTKQSGDAVNLEVDLLARYVQRLLQFDPKTVESGLTLETLQKFGYVND
ncbi:MAG: riboflavin synthase [Candidatus Omnitrophota bacterium]|jgi:riboflavin synthase|nr:MAG: riboflavin synthase [Candidatus Omnitrophota bacterium]